MAISSTPEAYEAREAMRQSVAALQNENDALRAEINQLREIIRELESDETLIDVSDSRRDLEKEVAGASLSSYAYPLDRIDGWQIKEGKYTVKVDGPSMECEAEIGDGLTAGVRFDARLVGLVFEASN